MKPKCTGPHCYDASVRRQKGRGSFIGWALWLCSRCGQVVKMKEVA